MRRRPSPDHQEAVTRRLALLSAELAAVREPATGTWGETSVEEDPQPDWTAEHTRVATRPRMPLHAVPSPSPAAEEVPRPVVPVPGRHAARRPGGRLADALHEAVPETLRGRAWLGPSQVAVLAVLVALALAVTCWWVLRGRPQEVTAPVASASALAPLSSPSPPPAGPGPANGLSPVAASASGATGTVTVDVEGKVGHPGIVVLDSGSRVVDALQRAGGARRGADLTGLNLARVLVDGEQVLVGVPAAAAPPAPGASAPAAGVPGGPLVNLNTATESELEALPEVGPVTAQSILTWRDQHGGFSSVDELLEVDGIGDATLSKLAPLVTV
jgi:competence protein ComEA